MDDIVKQAMAKWPNVPACYGWLALDTRGQWWLRDAQAQACGAFTSGIEGAKGHVLRHEKLAEFIGRNYLVEADGCWFFQNGPQRVYVELEVAPWIWRVHRAPQGLEISSHTGQRQSLADVQQAVMDEEGRLYLQLPQGLGMVHSMDMLDAAAALEHGELPEPQEQACAHLQQQFGFVLSPEMLQKE